MAAVYRALAVALLGLVVAGPVGGQSEQASEQETRARLERLQRDIKEINAEISRDNQRKGKLQEQLRQAEVALGALQRDIAANQRAIAASEAELDGLQAQRVDLEQARNAQQARIALELKTAWQMGQQGQVRYC